MVHAGIQASDPWFKVSYCLVFSQLDQVSSAKADNGFHVHLYV